MCSAKKSCGLISTSNCLCCLGNYISSYLKTYLTFYLPLYNIYTGIPKLEVREFNTIQIPVPDSTQCQSSLYFVWPQPQADLYYRDYCICSVRPSELFNTCASVCASEFDVYLSNNFIVFSNFTSNNDSVLIHFLCITEPCRVEHCTLIKFVASYRLLLKGNN